MTSLTVVLKMITTTGKVPLLPIEIGAIYETFMTFYSLDTLASRFVA